ncbi:amidohydrolase family protein [Streptomyces sp. NPDC002577]
MNTPSSAAGPVHEALAGLVLVDHHCHGVVTADPGPERFESLITEGEAWPGSGISSFDSPVGVAIRRYCAPVLGLPRHAPAAEYLARRAQLGWREVNRRFVSAAATGVFCVDTGYTPDRLTTPAELAASAGGAAAAYEVVRLESVAEAVADEGVEPGEYAAVFRAAAQAAVERPGTVAVKSVAAYRTGFDIDPSRPSDADVTEAARRWLHTGEAVTKTHGPAAESPVPHRLDDPVLMRHLLWTAVDLGLPLQLHTGFGDSDIRMHRVDPTHLTDWLHMTSGTVPVLLLHCWPYQRQAGYLATVFEQVYLDVGLTLHHVGPARARAILEEALETTPFRKLLYSSDAYGVAEFYQLGALAFRQGMAALLQDRVDSDDLSLADALRIVAWTGRDNAVRVYGLPESEPGAGTGTTPDTAAS